MALLKLAGDISDKAHSVSNALASGANTIGDSIIPKTDKPLPQKEIEVDEKTKQENEDAQKEMEWFNDMFESQTSNKGNLQIMGQIWEQIAGQNLMSKLTNRKQHTVGKILGKLSHRMDLTYPKCNELNALDMFDAKNNALVNEMRYIVRYAMCSYPPSFIVAMGLKTDVSYAFKSTATLLNTVFDIKNEDIIINKCSFNFIPQNRTHQPSFFLLVDHHKNTIILSIRGSSSISDALTDVNAHCKAFKSFNINGTVHEGIFESAKYVFDLATVDLVKLCKKYPKYKLIITGHSLGAGTAAMLGLMYRDHPVIHKQNRLTCYAFASPCIVSSEFTELCVDYIHSIALSTDIVTRLGLESMKQYNKRLEKVTDTPRELVLKAMYYLDDPQIVNDNYADGGDGANDLTISDNDETDNGNTATKPVVNEEEQKVQAFLRELKAIESPDPSKQLFPLGKVIWLVPKMVMDDDIVRRRRALLNLKEITKETTDETKENAQTSETPQLPKRRQSLSQIFNQTINNVQKGFSEFSETMDNSIMNTGGAKYRVKYDASKWIICDGTSCRAMFQQMVIDFPESGYAHFPQRYLWAFDATLKAAQYQDV